VPTEKSKKAAKMARYGGSSITSTSPSTYSTYSLPFIHAGEEGKKNGRKKHAVVKTLTYRIYVQASP
jgi:hypothetical protein